MPTRDATLVDASAIARVHVDGWRTTYRGLMTDELLDGLSYERRERQWRAAIAAAGEGGSGVVGFASGGECRGDWGYDGELYAIYLFAAHQGRGLGRALLLAVAERLAAQGQRSMLLWVLDTNAPGRGFYEALGGVLAGEKAEAIGGATIRALAYGWPDLADLLTRMRRT